MKVEDKFKCSDFSYIFFVIINVQEWCSKITKLKNKQKQCWYKIKKYKKNWN